MTRADIKISPRAKRAALSRGLPLSALNFTGTGYDGGICEQDVLAYVLPERKRISPVAKRIAEELNINLEGERGSGVNEKIMKKDVLRIAKSLDANSGRNYFASGDMTPDGKQIDQEIPLGGLRKIIADRMSKSKFSAPHLYFTQKVDVKSLLELKDKISDSQRRKVSLTDLIAKAVVLTIKTYPDMNSSLLEDKIIRYKSINLGIAVAAPKGLIVPVVKNAQDKTVIELCEEFGDLFTKARSSQLVPDDYSGGTFTISNLGMFGIENFTAIINPPEAGILAVSAVKDEPCVLENDAGQKILGIRPMMNITLSVDHRLIDGLLAAQFVTEVKRILEHPSVLISE